MMRRRGDGRSGWVLAAVMVAALALAQAAVAAEFSADMVTTAQRMTVTGTIYVKGKNVRHEVSVGQQKQIVIVNAGKKVVWSVDPVAKTYWEKKLSDKDLASATDELKGRVPPEMQMGKPKKVGTETVNGYVCDKMVAQGKGGKITTWVAQKLTFPIRTDVTPTRGGTIRQEYKNIKLRSLPASLFELPKGYKKVQSPMQAMQGMSGGMQGRRGGMRRAPQGRAGRGGER